jgi:hypothetical protein
MFFVFCLGLRTADFLFSICQVASNTVHRDILSLGLLRSLWSLCCVLLCSVSLCCVSLCCVIMLCVIMLGHYAVCHYAECRYAECRGAVHATG